MRTTVGKIYYFCTSENRTHTKMKGRVKWFDSKKGFGFLICEDGKEVFVHFSGIIKDGFKALVEGQRVEFEIEAVDRGEQAINVVVIPKDSE